MNFKEILELIDKVAERGIGAVEIEQAGTRVRIEGKSQPPAPQVIHSYVDQSPAAPALRGLEADHHRTDGQLRRPRRLRGATAQLQREMP